MTPSTHTLLPHIDSAGRLIGHDGTPHSRVTWASALVRKLTFATRFPARARRLAEAYERRLAPLRASDAERAELAAWVVGAAPYLGSAGVDHVAELTARHPALADLAAREAPALAAFLEDALDPPSAPVPRSPGRGRVVVFYSDLGGGTRTVAEAVAELLGETEDLEPVLLSLHADVQRRDNPFYAAFGVQEADLYNEALGDGGDLGLIDRCREARAALRPYFVPESVEEAARVLAGLDAQHVISTLPGYPQLAQIASAEAPFTILHADFGINATLAGEEAHAAPPPYRQLDPERVTIGLSAEYEEPTLDTIRASLGPRYDRLFRVIGYPVRRAFSPPTSSEALERLRVALGVAADEQIVLFTMGRGGMGDRLIRIVRQLLESPPDGAGRFHAVVVCGGSEHARRGIEDAVRATRSRVRTRVTGLLPAAELAGYMHLAAAPGPPRPSATGPARGGVVVSKPGGATTAECVATGAHLLLLPGLPWEEKNQEFAIARGSARACSEADLLPSLGRALREPHAPPPSPIDWRPRLLAHLRRPLR